MPLGVVDHLEVVQVDEEHPGDGAAALAPGERVADPVQEQHPVGQSGQRVVEGPVGELALHLPLLGDVAQGEHQPAHRRIGPQVVGVHLDLDRGAVGAQQPPVVALGVQPGTAGARGGEAGVPAAHPGQRLADRPAVLGRDEVGDQGAGEAVVAEDAFGGGARGVADGVVAVEDQDDVAGALHQGAEVGLAVASGDLLAQHDALDRERGLAGQDLQRAPEAGQLLLGAGDDEGADQRVPGRALGQGERAEQGARHAVQPGGEVVADVLDGQQPGLPVGGEGEHLVGFVLGAEQVAAGAAFGVPYVQDAALGDGEQRDMAGLGRHQGGGGGLDGVGDLLDGDGRGEGGAGESQRAFPGDGLAAGAHHDRQPGEHQQVDEGGEGADHPGVAGVARGGLDHQDGRRDQ